MVGGVQGETKTSRLQTVFPARGTRARREGRAAATGGRRHPGWQHPAGRGLARWAARERRGVRDTAVPWGKPACDSLWPLDLSVSAPLVPARVFFLRDSSVEVPWEVARV